MKKILALLSVLAMGFTSIPSESFISAESNNSFETLKFDFGGLGTADGFIGVPAADAYNASKGYGFSDTSKVENVSAGGSGALSDAVRFVTGSSAYTFNADVPNGVYKITVTTGDVESTSIFAEGMAQILFMTGNNAVDSFSIPVTDGQLNLYATAGISGTPFSISAVEIEQISAETQTKPTIWVCGDSTAASYYNVSEDAHRGWGQYLEKYVDSEKYNVRNLSVSGICANHLLDCNFFDTVEYYGTSEDIFLLSVGINDYIKAYNSNRDNPDSSSYIENVTEMVKRAKAKGMRVCLVHENGELKDCAQYPVIQKKWFYDETEKVASEEQVEIIDLFHSWLVYCLENTYVIAQDYYTEDGLHPNAAGADKMAELVIEELFAEKEPVKTEDPDEDKDFDSPSTVIYQTEVSGQPVANPHKGFVLTTYHPGVFESDYEYGIGGSKENHSWDVVTLCNGVHYWSDINPAEDVYNWEEIDNMIAAAWKHNMTYIIRILPYSHLEGSHDNYGAEHDFVPQWIYDKGAKKNRVKLKEDTSIELDVPVWDDPVYLEACKKFASALAEHYDGDKRVEFIDIRPFGNWGEWHFSQVIGSDMPSVEIQKDMLKYYSDAFDETLIAVPSDAFGEVYEYALSLGIAKRDDGLIGSSNEEWNLRLSYKANIPALAENAGPYSMMLENSNGPYGPLKWTETRFRECIEIGHLTITAFDQDSLCGYKFYQEQKDVIDEMVNRIGYNFTVTSAKRNGNKLKVKIKNTGVAPCYFGIDLCAEITDKDGNKIESFGKPVKIEKGTFHDEDEKTFIFEYDGELDENAIITLAMYESDNPLLDGINPNVKFDNKNTFTTNRLNLVAVNNEEDIFYGDLNHDNVADLTDLTLLSIYLMTGKGISANDIKAADIDSSGEVDIADLAYYKQYVCKDTAVISKIKIGKM